MRYKNGRVKEVSTYRYGVRKTRSAVVQGVAQLKKINTFVRVNVIKVSDFVFSVVSPSLSVCVCVQRRAEDLSEDDGSEPLSGESDLENEPGGVIPKGKRNQRSQQHGGCELFDEGSSLNADHVSRCSS